MGCLPNVHSPLHWSIGRNVRPQPPTLAQQSRFARMSARPDVRRSRNRPPMPQVTAPQRPDVLLIASWPFCKPRYGAGYDPIRRSCSPNCVVRCVRPFGLTPPGIVSRLEASDAVAGPRR